MSLYHGWNREEMQRAGTVFNEPSSPDSNRTHRATSSFTPINHNAGQSQFVSPLKTLISTALDSDILYDRPDEYLPRVAAPKGRKRGLTQANKGRIVSLGAVWEYNDDGDLQYGVQGAGVEDHIPKKRKVTPLKRSKSIKATSKTLSEFWEDRESTRQTHTPHDEKQDSQLTTPPDSGKKGKERAVSSTLQSKAKKTKPFKNPTIKKPAVAREKDFQEGIPSSKSVTTHQGWTTTEDAVKLNSNGIAKTTLDKLAVFRYKSSADPAVPLTSLKLLTECEVRMEKDEGHELSLEPRKTVQPSSSLDLFPSRNPASELPPFESPEVQIDNGLEGSQAQDPRLARFPSGHDMLQGDDHDRFFTDALWKARSTSQPTPCNSQNASNRDVNESQFQQHPPNRSNQFDQSSAQYPQGHMDIFPGILASPSEQNQHVASSFEPNSSEAGVFRCLSDYTSINQPHQQGLERSEVETLAMQNDTTACFEHRTEVDQTHESEVRGSFHPTGPDFGESPPPMISSDQSPYKARLPKSLIEVHVERSDIDDVDAVPRDVSKDYELDEFDEGLDDNDLVGMMFEAVVPDTQFSVKLSGRENHGVRSRTHIMEPAQNSCAPSKPIDLTLEASNPDSAAENHRTGTPPNLSSEPGDEYPMDEGDKEIFKLPEHMNTGVIGYFQAPESLQSALGDDPGLGEVYDSSLHFSPPKDRHNPSSPTKVPNDLHTDNLSIGNSPVRRSDTELLPVAKEEDWDFIRSSHAGDAEVQVISEAFSDLQRRITRTTTDSLERRESLFSPRLGADIVESDSATAPTSAAQIDSASIMWILDDSHEYRPLRPFARPNFPALIRDRTPITGVSAQTFIRVCFRIGEMFKEGARCEALKQDAVIELFARVIFSSQEPGTTKQHFQFADLWHDRPPFPNGILANYKTTGLAASESKVFIGADEGTMARCLGRLKRDSKSVTGWMLHIITIRTTDWEEIKWTKRIVSAACLVKSETMALSKL